MKKAIILVDMENSKFLMIKEDNRWKLPTLEGIREINEIELYFEDKYKNKIRNIDLIEEKEDYYLLKCFLTGTIEKLEYKSNVINELYSDIDDEQHKKILFDISKQVYMEILNDSFWLGIILTIEDKIINEEYKYILSDFLLFFSSIFCVETINYRFGEIKNKNFIKDSEIKKLRKSYLKKCPLYSSKDISAIIKEMGINFDEYVFDIVVFLLNDELIDINSRMWNKRKWDLYNSIIMSPRNWIKNCLPENNEIFERLRETYVEEFISRFNKKRIIKKSYSTYKLFDNTLSYNEKVYILQRIGLIKTILMISNEFCNGNYIKINEKEGLCLNFNKFLIKAKATIIELIWNDNKSNDIPVLKDIMEKISYEMDENFYKLNRKCRDNIHYGFYNKINDIQYKELSCMQDFYLNYVVKEFEKKLNLKLGLGYKIALCFAKLQYWANN